jgi:pre-mRNA-processing factor 19
MSITHCGLSGCALTDPVVCTKTGHIYEKSVITHHINQTGRCPITNIELSLIDIIPLQVSPISKPKPLSSLSVPGLLQSLQEEWNATVLETHTIKKQNDLLKQELSHALYQFDAACRVIAKLVKEKEELAIALQELSKNNE